MRSTRMEPRWVWGAAALALVALALAVVALTVDTADTSGPRVELLAPAEGSAADPAPNLGGLAGTDGGDRPGIDLSIYRGSSARGRPLRTLSSRSRPSGAFSVLAPSPLEPGIYTVRAEQRDDSANVGHDQLTFRVAPPSDPVMLAAGDISSCYTRGDELTAELLDGQRGTVVPLGDTAYDFGTAAQISRCYDPTWGRHLARSRPIVGDHEYERSQTAQPFFDYFGEAAPNDGIYSYRLGQWRVIALNSYCYETGPCRTRTDEWFARQLARDDSRCTAVLYHEPRFSSGDIHGNSSGSAPLWRAMYDGGVDVVLAGSEHIYERFAPQTPSGAPDPNRGVRQFTVGTGGYLRYGIGEVQPNSEVRETGTWGILRLELHPDSYEWRFLPTAGGSFTDAGRAACH